ncbi:helix-turn-helix domain-containing protein [Patescibacteria group bacterium]|nr:helix-turn-helix domain-containing protein [Patescibacteria group bacterium]
MDPIKDSFDKVKTDIIFLYEELDILKRDIQSTKKEMINFCEILKEINNSIKLLPKKENKDVIYPPSSSKYLSTHNDQNKTTPTHNPTHKTPFKALNSQNLVLSTGNRGVPTDRQTDRQTDNKQLFVTPKDFQQERPLKKTPNFEQEEDQKTILPVESSFSEYKKDNLSSIDNAARILSSLDSIKKDIRLKFKRLTEQEILVFSTLYQIDEEEGYAEYKTLSKRLNLSESSIRDYIGRLIKKGIPVEKKRLNNKIIHLSISKNLKKIASLPTILELRDL